MIGVTGDALSCDLTFRTVAGDAIRDRGHEHVGGVAALPGVVAVVAFDARVFGVIEIGPQHPAID